MGRFSSKCVVLLSLWRHTHTHTHRSYYTFNYTPTFHNLTQQPFMHEKHNIVNININPPFPTIPSLAECENSTIGRERGINLVCNYGFVCTCDQQPTRTYLWRIVQMCAMVITINIILFIGTVRLINVAIMQIQFPPHMVRYPFLLS